MVPSCQRCRGPWCTDCRRRTLPSHHFRGSRDTTLSSHRPLRYTHNAGRGFSYTKTHIAVKGSWDDLKSRSVVDTLGAAAGRPSRRDRRVHRAASGGDAALGDRTGGYDLVPPEVRFTSLCEENPGLIRLGRGGTRGCTLNRAARFLRWAPSAPRYLWRCRVGSTRFLSVRSADFSCSGREPSGEVAASCPGNLDWRLFVGWAVGRGNDERNVQGPAGGSGSRDGEPPEPACGPATRATESARDEDPRRRQAARVTRACHRRLVTAGTSDGGSIPREQRGLVGDPPRLAAEKLTDAIGWHA